MEVVLDACWGHEGTEIRGESRVKMSRAAGLLLLHDEERARVIRASSSRVPLQLMRKKVLKGES